MTAPLTLTFNYTTRDTQNEYCLGRTAHFTPHGETARFYPENFARKSETIRTIPLAESLSFAAESLRSYAQSRHPAQAFADDVVFIDEKGNRQTITPATFTPH